MCASRRVCIASRVHRVACAVSIPCVLQGQYVDAQDVFQSSVDGAWVTKWRLAEVLEATPQAVLVHYVGWSHRFDEWIDLARNPDRVAYAAVVWVQLSVAALPVGVLERAVLESCW